jgi:hypothetical protein
MYDLDTDGEVIASIVSMEPGEKLYNLGAYTSISPIKTQGASYPVSEVSWQMDARDLKQASVIGVGNSTVEPPIKGTDARTGKELTTQGLAGIRYRIQADVSAHTTVALHPGAGFFQGAIRVDGNFIPVPAGGLTSNDILILQRTAAAGKRMEIELLPAEGSSVPLDLLLIPLHRAGNQEGGK